MTANKIMATKAKKVDEARKPSLSGHRRSCSLRLRRVSALKGKLGIRAMMAGESEKGSGRRIG